MKQQVLAGIDFGSKMAGTTVIAVAGKTTIRLFSSRKNEDADSFLSVLVKEKGIEELFIDAPLSLPGVYRGILSGNDYFFRESDRVLKAMSPMFLGALTARAMKLCSQWKDAGIQCREVYPPAFALRMDWIKKGYKKEDESRIELQEFLTDIIGLPLPHELSTWHEVDALIALAIGKLLIQGKAKSAGNSEEGLIYF